MVAVEDHALSVRLSDELYEQLRRFAFERRITQADVIREALKRFMKESRDGATASTSA